MSEILDINAFALSLRGVAPYREIYKKLLIAAFTSNGDILNAKRLRELAGGGSQETAQSAIDEFKKEIAKRFAGKFAFGKDIPHEVSVQAAELIQQIWAACTTASTNQFNADRAHLCSSLELAKNAETLATNQSKSLAQELGKAQEAGRACTAENQALKAQIESLKKQLDQERQRSQSLGAEVSLLNERINAESALHQQSLRQITVANDGTVSTMQRQLQAQSKRIDALIEAERSARAANSEAQIARARADQRIESAQSKVQMLEVQLQSAQDECKRLSAENKVISAHATSLGKQLLRWVSTRYGSSSIKPNLKSADTLLSSMDKDAVRIAHLIESAVQAAKNDLKPQRSKTK